MRARTPPWIPLLVASLLTGCAAARGPSTAPIAGATPPGVLPLLASRGPIPTEALRKGEQRTDIEIRPTHHDTTPSVVAVSESPVLLLGPDMRVSLSGSADGQAGWSVDNFLLFERLDAQGTVRDRFVVGFSADPVYAGNEMVENVGDWSPRFDARSPDLTPRLPVGEPFKLRVTALDNGITGSVSDVFLVLERQSQLEHELRDETFWDQE